jgi:hypothetical protein
MEAALDAGADDVQREDARFIVSTPGRLPLGAGRLKTKGIDIDEAELAMVPKTTVKVNGKDAESLLKAARDDRGPRRRAEGLGELRHRRRGGVESGVIVLGVDPGTATTGYGVVKGRPPSGSSP